MKRWVLVAALLGSAGVARAEPAVGTTMSYGESLGGEASGRFGANLYLYSELGGGWIVGGELDGSIEGFTGGYGCGTLPDDGGMVPAVAVTCFQPGVGAHALFGATAAPSAGTQLRLELGLGATSVYLIPGQGGDARRDTHASGLVRGLYLAEVGRALTGDWWLGVSLEERAVGAGDPRFARSFGVVLEGRSAD